jgi:hypothetical protein
MFKFFKSYFKFILNPKENCEVWRKKDYPIILITVLLVSYLLIFILSSIPFPKALVSFGSNAEISIGSYLLIAPLYEELLFRLPLKTTSLNITISFCLFIASVIVVVGNLFLQTQSSLTNFYIASFAIASLLFLYLRMTRYYEKFSIEIRWFGYYFYAFVFLFASAHFLTQRINIYSLLAYLVYGYSLSFIRLNTNFFCSVAMHYVFITPILIRL